MVLIIFTMLCNPHQYVYPKLSLSSVYTLYSLPFSSPSGPWSSLFFLSLWICLFLVHHISGITQYVSFYVWLILLSIMLSRSIHVVAYIKISFLFIWLSSMLLYVYTTFCLPIYPLMDTWVFPCFSCCE